MNVGVLVVCCLLATSVTGNEDEREEFAFDLEMSFEADEILGPVDTLAAVTITTVTTKPGALKSPTAESEPVPEPVPEPSPKLTNKANQSTNAKLDIKRKTPYSFEYAVEDSKSGLDYGHKESSDGEVVTGTYYVLLPDGRKETVKYKADGNGYVADVSYEGEVKNNDNSQSQKPSGTFASSGTSAQLQAYSNISSPVSMISTLNTSTRPPQISSSMSSVTTKGPFLLPSSPAAEAPSAGKASVVSTVASAVSSTSSIISATDTITTPSPFASSTPTLIPSSILNSTPTTTVTAATTTPSTATIALTNAITTQTTISANATYATPINNGTTTPTINIPTNGTTTSTTATNTIPTSATTTPVNGTTAPSTTLTSATTTTTSAANSTSINGATNSTNVTNNTTTTPTTLTNVTKNVTTTPTSPINTTSSTSNPAVIATSTARSLSSTTSSSSVPKSTLNSTFSPVVSVTVSASLSLSNQNSTSVSLPQLSQTNTLNMVSQAPGTSPSENQSFFQALAGFIRSAGPTFIYCRNLLPSCSDSTRFPQASFCSNCNSLQKICSKSESIGETPPVYNDTLQAFQTLVPAAPVWPANKSPVTELVQKTVDSSSSEKPSNSNSTLPPATPSPSTQVPQSPSLPKKVVSPEVPEGLADIVQSADTHFRYCQKIRSFCPRLESTRPYWESSSETPSKQKEFLLSTIQACSYCRSLWPICSEIVESSEFLLDPSQLFTLHGLEEDVRNAIYQIPKVRISVT
ncbi:hypothetical protein DAPPUDRAFT_254702 [Daphnia pulex]|uniref:Cuticle protein n=1 Tax=Daphnia pulex TaxID=6669 RepID=E9H7P4_DAPPU|nr:hypothetical protein DAPPUDRAFT_254702 [Daphnia pulex]|eukprot:EFX72270.1 hypothetical protein DAPPUDRAFT_254702 [Daphnia pulex]